MKQAGVSMHLPENIRAEIYDQILRIVAPVMAICMGILFVGVLVIEPSQYDRLIGTSVVMGTGIIAWLLAWQGKQQLGIIVLIIGMVSGAVTAMLFNGGIRAPAYIAFIPVTSIFVILFGLRGGVIVLVLSMVLGGLFFQLDALNMIPQSNEPPAILLILVICTYVIMQIYFVLLPTRLMLKALHADQEQRQRIKQSEKRLKTLFADAPDTILTLGGADHGIREFNKKAVATFACAPEELTGKAPWELSPPIQLNGEDSKSKAQRIIATVLRNQIPLTFEWQHQRVNGELFDAEVSLAVLEEDPETILQAIIRDITERKKLDKQVRLMQHWVEHSVDLFFWVREDSKILYTNQAVCELLGYSHAELDRMRVGDFDLEITSDFWPEFTQILRQQGSYSFESRLRAKDGTIWPVEITANLLQFENKNHFFAYGREISSRIKAEEERKALESRLVQAQKLEAIGTLAGGIAHDFNNILAGIVGYTELALAEVEHAPSLEKKLNRVMEASNRAAGLVKQILSFSRNQKHELTPVSPLLITKEVLTLMRSTLPASIEISQSFHAERYVLADATNIHQVLMNLCTNAAHAMEPQGGTLTVSVHNVTLDQHALPHHLDLSPGEFVKISVRDTGHGMSPEVREKAFDPFFTTKELGKGTGMGLSAVHGIVADLGGFILLESQPHQGTTVDVLIPSIPEPAQRDHHPASLPSRGGTERILFVDDEEIQIEIIESALSPHGYQIDSFAQSTQAWEHFKHHPDAYDMVITDMTMPKMTGDTLCKKIKSIRPTIPVIMCTGFSEIIDEDKANAIGVAAFLYKPIVLNKLFETIRDVFASGE